MSSLSPINTAAAMSASPSAGGSMSPRQPAAPKNVAFELLFMDSPQYRARLPMRVQIYPHDATESIVTTVKNFYGLYSNATTSKGVSFEDEHGNTLIARYENFTNNMNVYVRVIEEGPIVPANYGSSSFHTAMPGAASGPPQDYYADGYQSADRVPRQHTRSPTGGVRDDLSESASVTSKEQLGTTDISVDNIVEGGRRKRAKFESSELPLFAPPQMPAATSNPSVSPARRIDQHRAPVGFNQSNSHNPFTNPRSIHSSQYYNGNNVYATPNSEDRRHRGSISYSGNGVLPTPDPTVGSCMSEEDKDVAIQLMRLGEMSNVPHGRTSTSAHDDTFSGKADAASSTGATSDGESDSEDELPPARRQKLDMSGNSRSIYPTTESNFMLSHNKVEYSSEEEYDNQAKPEPVAKPKTSKPKASKPASVKTKKATTTPGAPMSPASATHSRKPSVTSVGAAIPPAGDDEPDLSTKPRCQRCRKSKKGCDRQRPCGRCRDAGLTADQCISEDEGNGRKGRYGRHMGVPIKKEELPTVAQPTLLPAAPIAPNTVAVAMSIDKSKKRKR